MSIGAVICAWCSAVMVPGDASKPASHGICADCRDRLEREAA